MMFFLKLTGDHGYLGVKITIEISVNSVHFCPLKYAKKKQKFFGVSEHGTVHIRVSFGTSRTQIR
jgi:hypothetical protein